MAVLLAVLILQAAAATAVLAHTGSSGASGSTETVQPRAVPLGGGRTAQLISLGGTSTDALLQRVAAELGASVEAIDRFWGADWGTGAGNDIVVVAAGSEGQFVAEARLDPQRQWPDIAAVTVADEVDPSRRSATGQRIILAPGAAGMSDEALRIVLRHELFHLAARGDTAVDAPRWLTEGVADFAARPAEPLPPDAAAVTDLPTDAALDEAGPARARGYDRAWWFARFVADTYGVDALRRLYLLACGPDHPDLTAAVRGALGIEMSELQGAWVAWLGR